MEGFRIREAGNNEPFVAILSSAETRAGHTAESFFEKFGPIQTLQDTPVLTVIFGIGERREGDFRTMQCG